MIKRYVLPVLLLVMAICLPGAVAQEPENTAPAMMDGTMSTHFQHAQKASRESAVKIEGLQGGHGSGTYVELAGHYLVITAKHVVDRSEIYYVRTSREKVVGQVVWMSADKDIAVLKVPKLMSRRAVSLSGSRNLDVGDDILYTGYPASYELLTARGVVSGHSRDGSTLLQGFVWFGYSGSGAFDDSGKLRGIVYGIGVEGYRGMPQFLETLVYVHEITKSEIAQIKKALLGIPVP